MLSGVVFCVNSKKEYSSIWRPQRNLDTIQRRTLNRKENNANYFTNYKTTIIFFLCPISFILLFTCIFFSLPPFLYRTFFPQKNHAENSTNKGPYDGLIVVMCGHGTMGQFVASDDPGYTETKEEKYKRLSLDALKAMWNSKSVRKLGPFPKIFIKAACRGGLGGEPVEVRYPERPRGGVKKWVHPYAEMFSIYASMPGETSRDSSGEAMGCYLVSMLNKILRDPKWRLETLNYISLRMRRGIGHETTAKEWVDVEHSHSKPILLRRKSDPLELLIPPQIRVHFFCLPPHLPLSLPLHPQNFHRLPKKEMNIERRLYFSRSNPSCRMSTKRYTKLRRKIWYTACFVFRKRQTFLIFFALSFTLHRLPRKGKLIEWRIHLLILNWLG